MCETVTELTRAGRDCVYTINIATHHHQDHTMTTTTTTTTTQRVGMKLGTQTGSLINHMHSRGVIGQPTPVAGMGATILQWSDRSPATIFRVFTVGKATVIEVRDDAYTCTEGSSHDGSASYTYRIQVNGHRQHFRQRPAGDWERVSYNETTKRWAKNGGPGLRIGERDRYYDPSF